VTVNGRHHFHTPEFRRRERLYRHLAKAEAWIEENLAELLVRRDPKARTSGGRRP
jgi:predicted metal-dependent hydrolase